MHQRRLLCYIIIVCISMFAGFKRSRPAFLLRTTTVRFTAGSRSNVLGRLLQNPVCADHHKWITKAVKATQEHVCNRTAISIGKLRTKFGVRFLYQWRNDVPTFCASFEFPVDTPSGEASPLPSLERSGVFQALVDKFFKRQIMHNEHPDSWGDKRYNPVTVLCGPRGSGKSTVLTGLQDSEEYKKYAALGSIVVHFDQSMGDYKNLDARILFTALVSVGLLPGDQDTWQFFASTAKCRRRLGPDGSVRDVVHTILDEGTRCLLCIDDLTNRKDAKKLLDEMCDILSNDQLTDVVVSSPSSSAHRIRTMLWDIRESARGTTFLPLASYSVSHKSEAYAAAVEQYLSDRCLVTLNTPTHASEGSCELKRRLLAAAPILAAGHVDTIAALLNGIRAPGGEWQQVQAALTDPDCSVGTLLRALCNLPCLTNSFPDAATDRERDYILSAEDFTLKYEPVLRAMAVAGKCDLVPCSLRYFKRAQTTTNLVALFRMIDHCAAESDKKLGAKSKFLKILFGQGDKLPSFSSLWVRARALAYAITGHDGTQNHPFRGFSFRRTGDVTVRFAQPGENVAWERDAIVVTEDGRAGWDILACYAQTVYEYDEGDIPGLDRGRAVGIHRMYFAETALVTLSSAEELVDLVAHRIKAAVDDRFTAEGSDDANQRDLFARLTLIFSVYEEVHLRQICTKTTLLGRMEVLLRAAAKVADFIRWCRAIDYVESQYGDNIRFLGKQDLDSGMPKVLLPLAEFVKVVAL